MFALTVASGEKVVPSVERSILNPVSAVELSSHATVSCAHRAI